ncbi:MAG: flavodoxin [Sphaerochaetaceae bacterium]
MTGIIYGSSMGNTEAAARIIKDKLGDGAEIIDVASVSAKDFERFDMLILGTSTWGVGDLQDDWEEKLPELQKADLSGKKIAFFGLGDQQMYGDSYVDAMGLLYEAVADSAAVCIGAWPTEGYDFTASKAVINDKFIGLALDEDNQSDLTESRISEWMEGL